MTSTYRTTAVENIRSGLDKNDRLAYFYCSFSDNESLDVNNILGSILSQICHPNDSVYRKIENIFGEKSKGVTGKPQRLKTNEVLQHIVEQCQDKNRCYIFIDAVNECSNPHDVLTCLESIVTDPSICVQAFISSINEKDIEEMIQSMPNLSIETLNEQEMRNDIHMLIKASLETHPRLRKYPLQLKENIFQALASRAQGM